MIYENVKKFADQQGKSIASIEKEANIGNGIIGGWRTSFPRLNKLQAVAKVLGVTVADLIGEGEDAES